MRAQAIALGDRIAEQAAHLDAAMHRLLSDLRDFDRQGYWHEAGARSCAHWLSWRVSWDLGTAREHLRVARRLAELPAVGAALSRGELSYSKVRAITRVATAATEPTLLQFARQTTAAQLEVICRRFRAVERLDEKREDLRASRRRVVRRDLDDGLVRIEAVLRPEEAAVLWAAIDGAARDVSAGARFDRADGLMAIAQREVRGEHPGRSAVEVVMTVSADALRGNAEQPLDATGSFPDGGCVSAEAARRLTCDCAVVPAVLDAAGTPLSVGRKTRSIPTALARALALRDPTCRFPGCTNHLFVEAHHIQHWAHGGETSLGNTVRLCSFHHVFVHEGGFRVELDELGQPRFFGPHGVQVHPEPPRRHRTRVWETIHAANRDLAITPQTGQCAWDGWPVDYDRCVEVLWQRR